MGQTRLRLRKISRRAAMRDTVKMLLGVSVLPRVPFAAPAAASASCLRAINIMNFLRAEEPRSAMDLFAPVREQMALIKQYKFPATWLLQYDALVEGPFVDFLKKEMPPEHEVGFWFEMNRKLTDAAGVRWRGRDDWEWDYHVPSAFTIGYTPEERRKLTDAAMAGFRQVWGYTPKAVASWNLDALTMAHMSDEYKVEIFGLCRDQVATDGFTIWGGPTGGYYPSRVNAYCPALNPRSQISTPAVRLLGQDPVYYYDQEGGINRPDTIEPVWRSGQSPAFVRNFLSMIAKNSALRFSYAQLGQENSFGWPAMKSGYEPQLAELAQYGGFVETMSQTGRRFRKAFATTPAQSQVMLSDPFDRTNPGERSIWYQNRFYRANLHFRGPQVYLRDITVYSDRFPQPFLKTPTTSHGVEQRFPAVLDGYHWSDKSLHARNVPPTARRAQGYFALRTADGSPRRIDAIGTPAVEENGPVMNVMLDGGEGVRLHLVFGERALSVQASGLPGGARLMLIFDWVPELSALRAVTPGSLEYRYDNFDYAVKVSKGTARQTPAGVAIEGNHGGIIELTLAQPA